MKELPPPPSLTTTPPPPPTCHHFVPPLREVYHQRLETLEGECSQLLVHVHSQARQQLYKLLENEGRVGVGMGVLLETTSYRRYSDNPHVFTQP